MARANRATEAVVVPANAAPNSVTCLRSLGRRGIHTISVGIDGVSVSTGKTPPAYWSRYCDETVEAPMPGKNLVGYKDTLLSLAQREDVRTIVPMREEDSYVLSKYREAFADHVAPVWPSFDAVRTVHDRLRLVEAAEDAGVAVPETQLLDEVRDWDRELIVKARYAVLTDDYAGSLSLAETVAMGAATYLEPGVEPDVAAIRAEMGHVPIVQEYVPGSEYALWALYDRGDPVATCLKRQFRGFTYAGGTSIYRETTAAPRLEEAGRSLLDALDWHGFASVQFVEDATTGEFTLLEVNPRTWVSLPCAVRAGVDFPYYYWRLAGDDPIRADADYEVGFGTHLFRGEASYLLSVLRDDFPLVEPPPFRTALWEVMASFYDQPHLDYLALDDPRPFARELLNTVAEVP